MHKIRQEKLKKNGKKLFWIKALMNVKMVNIVMSLFYVHRGLELNEIFYLSMIWAITSFITEVPSSYLADHLGRKKTMMLGIVSNLMYWVFFFFADSFFLFAIAMVWYAMSFAMISGTDEALLYDSEKELEQTDTTLQKLGTYAAANNVFKIFASIIGVVIAKNLIEGQFQILIGIDVVATLIALGIGLTLIEARHKMDVEEIESGVMFDAFNLIRKSPIIMRAMMSKVIIFTASLTLFHYYQVFFTDTGLPLLILGIGFALMHTAAAIFKHFIAKHVPPKYLNMAIDGINILTVLLLICFVIVWVIWPNPYMLYAIFLVYVFLTVARNPLYAEFFHKKSKSYNRATTMSLVNFLKNIFDIPILFIAGILITYNIIAPYIFAIVLGLLVITFSRLSYKHTSSINKNI
ncbi:MAG: MFS transporter [Candidatus Magasanikbacteria bacterium]|nr:MFS transporter [Candidatus Magasanikbacteria bacterium]MBT4071461.1 MFS transporter [Candidatus Magasanikbacteria bacterium]